MTAPPRPPEQRKGDSLHRLRLGIGPTRDLVLIEGTVQGGVGDPRQLESPYQYFRIQPQRVQAWREANELEGRELMRNGGWLTSPPGA